MKRNLYLGMVWVLFSMFVIGAQAYGAPTLYDDFSEPYIDRGKWGPREFVREVSGGKLVTKIGNDAPTGWFSNTTSVNINYENFEAIKTIQCEITLVDYVLDSGTSPASRAGISGFFYNSLGGTNGCEGDIIAGVAIGDIGNGLEAFWGVMRVQDHDATVLLEIDSGTLLKPIQLEKEYTLKIVYDQYNSFEFSINDGTTTYTESFTVSAYPKAESAQYPFKGLVTSIISNEGSATGYVSALYDNFSIDYGEGLELRDDFETDRINWEKWQPPEFVREISGGELRLNVEAYGSLSDAAILPNDQSTTYLETGVSVESGSGFAPGEKGHFLIGGRYFSNESGDDFVAFTYLGLDNEGTLSAHAVIDNVSDGMGPPYLFWEHFGEQIFVDTMHTLSIEFTGASLIFKCDDETITYDITPPINPPNNGPNRVIFSRVNRGYMKTRIDDVYVMANTITGNDVVTEPVDGITGEKPVTVTFEEVSEEGTTSLVTHSQGDPEPVGFKLGDPPTYYEISTTAEVSGSIEICVHYSGVSYEDENELRLFHYENDQWEDRTSFLDTDSDIICGVVNSLSEFAIFEFEGARYCTTLGDDPKPSILDQDIFIFEGTEGEEVSIKVDADLSGSYDGSRATLIVKDRISWCRFMRVDRSTLPNEINATLPASGEYRIIVAEQPRIILGEKFRGDYCLTMGSSGEASTTLVPTGWVE